MKTIRVLGLLLGCLAGAAGAQTYPNKPITLIVPFAPGGGVDTMSRLIAEPLGKALGQPFVIDNRGGAGGNIGTEAAARASPDGYTLVMGSTSPNAVNVHLYARVGFDPIKDFAPIGYVSSVPNILVVAANSPYNTAAELIAAAKAGRGGNLTYGSAGVGSSQHLAAAMMGTSTGTSFTHVPYKGAGPAQADLLAGHIGFMLDTTGPLTFVKAGKMRALAVASKTRSPALPQVPTFEEAGIPGVLSAAWYGLMAPAGTPREIVALINTKLNEVLQLPETRRRLAEFGADIGGGTPEEFGRFVAAELVRYADVVKASGAKVE
jgi:tripartite-type tricarboxylate transporter receptor subunit TctC